MGYNWRFDLVFEYGHFLVAGVKSTLLLGVLALAIGIVVGLIVAVLRMTKVRALNYSVVVYVDIFRTVPPLAVLFWFFYVLPIVTGLETTAFISTGVALGLLSGASFSEIFRGGILSIAQGQWQAARALGMTSRQVYQRVILPQAITRMIPPTISQFISLLKATSLASAVGVVELQYQTNALSQWNLHPIENLTVTAFIYLALTLPQAYVSNIMYAKWLPNE